MLNRIRVLSASLTASCALVAAPALAVDAVANAGADVGMECSGETTLVSLIAAGSSTGDDVTYLWSAPGVEFLDAEAFSTSGDFPVGTTTVLLTVTVEDEITGEVAEATDEVDVSVSDTTPPTVHAKASPGVLWPPNHKMHRIRVDLQVDDLCDSDPEVVLHSVESDEPDNGRGDGNTNDDIQGAYLDNDDISFKLRAERQGSGDGRVYTAVYRVTDDAGNYSDAAAQVYTPHDMSHYKKSMKADHKSEKAAEKYAKRAAKAEKKAEKKAAKAAKKAGRKTE